MNPTEKRLENQYILYDGDLAKSFDPQFFEVSNLENQGRIVGQASGRGNTYFVNLDEYQCVLRHYMRGGFVAHLVKDRYIWRNLFRTRAWREWYLLGKLRQFDLQVPKPVAARVVRHGVLYSADIMVERIEGAITLATWLIKGSMSDDLWRKIGSTIRRFHQRGVYHADLNAHNIIIDADNNIYLIDFDKCHLRPTKRSWQLNNLNRLRRSLVKLKASEPGFQFENENWSQLVSGYTQK